MVIRQSSFLVGALCAALAVAGGLTVAPAAAQTVAPTVGPTSTPTVLPAPLQTAPATPATTMTLDVTIQLANGKPAPDGAMLTAYALPSETTSATATANPPACSAAQSVSQSRATLVIQAPCATQYANETGGQGVIGFGITFTNDYGQPVGAGSLTHARFLASDTAQSLVVTFSIDPAVEFVASDGTPPPSLTPVPPNTGSGVSSSGDSSRLGWSLLVASVLALGVGGVGLRRQVRKERQGSP